MLEATLLETSASSKNQKQKTDKAQQIHIPIQAQTETLISSAYNPVLVQTHARTSISSATNVDEPVVVNFPEKITDSIHEIDKLAMTEVHMAVVVEEPKDVLHNHPTVRRRQSLLEKKIVHLLMRSLAPKKIKVVKRELGGGDLFHQSRAIILRISHRIHLVCQVIWLPLYLQK
ncbi:hypothetical protein H5410_015051 [Solanum commersonii]|uniref:Uncharacterized protein n=1 Tax=Solanum commersonii TaxID=4109 RepID=A0A9J5ZSZ7_SOLCO|nr:hypothetical protein H5410_015051 [Solanum commersonii]